MRISFLVLIISVGITSHAQTILQSSNYLDPYLAGVVHFRLKESARNLGSSSGINHPAIQQLQTSIADLSISKRFPNTKKPEKQKNARGERFGDLSLIYTARFPETIEVKTMIRLLEKTGIVDVAEPHFVPQLCYVPNDDSISGQYALYKINAFSAWDVHKGDTSMVIGITDTGYDPHHPDLAANIKYNYGDPMNGIDDDNDGYIDNFTGWDTGSNDNDATSDGNWHGQHVTGLCSAVTDNQIGIAGTGFNCRFMHVKIANSNGSLTGSYEGVIYAAEHGCKVINCSWGGFQYSELNAEIIRYVAINLDCVVFCGAGNESNDRIFYPAFYEYAFAVGATDAQDYKADFSSYGYWVDAFAPGDLVLSTYSNGNYVRSGGTSTAAPIVAGCAAVMRSAFPTWSSQQIAQQLKQTADSIDQIPFNLPWQNKLGAGRINFFNALTQTGKPSIVLNEIQSNDGQQNLYLPGDTLRLSGTFINYLFPATAVDIQLNVLGSQLEVLEPFRQLGALQTLETLDITNAPFLFKISENVGYNEQAIIELIVTANGFESKQYIFVTVNADFINLQNNLIHTSIRSNSLIGVSGNGFLKGLGFQYDGNADLLYEAGLMVGNSQVILDNVRGDNQIDNDFQTQELLVRIPPIMSTTEQFRGSFGHTEEPNLLNVQLRAMSNSTIPNQNFVILEYYIQNTSLLNYESMYAGIFTDWDLINAGLNAAGYNGANKLGYVFTLPQDTIYTAVQVLNELPANYYAIDNAQGGAGGINATDGFSKSEKFIALSTTRPTTGAGNNGTDVVSVMSTGPFNLAPEESRTVAFALLGAHSLDELITSAVAAKTFYQQTGIPLSNAAVKNENVSVFPNPASKSFRIQGWDGSVNSQIALRDMSGRIILTQKISGEYLHVDCQGISKGIYFLTISSFEKTQTLRVVINN